MDNMRKDKSEKDVSVLAEEILKSYADSWAEAYADEAEELLRDDEQYRKAEEKYGSYRRKSLKQRVLRCAAIIICAVFLASVVLPIPQAHAWRVWWLNLVIHENVQDIDVRPNDDYAGEYYVSELPEGFELEAEKNVNGRKVANYRNLDGARITFTQIPNPNANSHIDNERTNYEEELIGEFQALVGESDKRINFEMMTENCLLLVSTNAGYEVGVEFIENLHKIS